MTTRFLTFHRTESSGNEVRMSPSAYYIECNYTPIAVRIYAETAPTREAQIDIFDDGVSIFNNRTLLQIHATSGVNISGSAVTAVVLNANQNSEESAEDFATNLIAEGSWIHCNLVDAGGGKNFSVHLELFSPDEPLTEEE